MKLPIILPDSGFYILAFRQKELPFDLLDAQRGR